MAAKGGTVSDEPIAKLVAQREQLSLELTKLKEEIAVLRAHQKQLGRYTPTRRS